MPRLIAALLLLPLPATAQSVCTFDAYSDISHDSIAIHAGPSQASEPLDYMLQMRFADKSIRFGSHVSVTQMQNGWAYITNATSFDGEYTIKDGWVDGEFIAFTAQTDVVFANPDAASDIVWRMNDVSYVKTLLDCDGEWAKVVIRTDNEVDFTGWVRGICANQETTCVGTFGDKAPAP